MGSLQQFQLVVQQLAHMMQACWPLASSLQATSAFSHCLMQTWLSVLRLPSSQLTFLWACSIEYNLSYVYHSMASYFNRDNVGLPGLTQYFRGESLSERGHAQMLMDFQVQTGPGQPA